MRPAPSGQQHEIRHGTQVAVVTEVGATLRSYSAGGLDVVDGFEIDEISPAGRGQVLAPWPNRLDGGRYAFEGREGKDHGESCGGGPDEGGAEAQSHGDGSRTGRESAGFLERKGGSIVPRARSPIPDSRKR